MAITQDYVSWSTGNDYKGASFVDGAFTVADMTLTKAGAFAASKANHWLYLDDNGSGEVTTGYYRIASVTSANAVVLATSPKSGANDPTDVKCTQHDGTTTKPWRSLQGAFDLLTRNTTDGNQVNLKAGTAHVNAAALDLTTFIAGGALTAAAPLIIRGYTSAANDGGMGEIDCNGATMWAGASYDYLMLSDLEIHSGGDNNLIAIGSQCVVYRCEIHKGASSPSGKSLLISDAWSGIVIGCYLHGSGSGAARAINRFDTVLYNYIVMDAGTNDIGILDCSRALHNIVVCSGTSATGISGSTCIHNICYSSAASTRRGIYAVSNLMTIAIDNIVVGWSGAGGDGLEFTNVGPLGHNAIYNCTNPVTVSDQKFIDLTANDVALAADPFTDAANGDFSLTAAGKTALRSLGWPASYLGAHANTDPHITIGPMQYGPTPAAAGGGGRPAFGDRSGGKF